MNESLNFWTYFLPAITFGFAAAVQPGPLSLYLISQTLRAGWRRTWPSIFTPAITDGPVAVLCLVILSTLPDYFLTYIQIIGGGFILFLAYRALMSWRKEAQIEKLPDITARKTLLNAMVINILNPNAYLGWSLVIGPMFLKGWKAGPGFGIGIIIGLYLSMFCTSAVILLLFHKARDRGPKLQRTLTGISAAMLGIFGVYQLVAGGIAIFK